MSNKKILLFVKEPEIKDFITVLVEGNLPFDVIESNDIEDAIARLDTYLDIQYAITDYDVREGRGKEFHQFNKDTVKKPFICIFNGQNETALDQFKSFFADGPFNHVILQSQIQEKLIPTLKLIHRRFSTEILQDNEKEEVNGKALFRIKITYFLNREKAESDVYVKLQKGKFIKIIKAGDEINKSTIQNILKKGQRYLYQEKEVYEKFVAMKFKELSSKLKESGLKTSEKMALQLHSIREVQDTVRNMGLSNAAIALTDEVVNSVEEVVKDSKNLRKLVKELLKTKSQFFTQSSILNYILGGIAQKSGWDSKTTLKKLIFASVFCDFAFDSSQYHLANILSQHDPSFEKLKPSEKKLIESHPLRGADLMKKCGNFLIDETTIVLQHHEKPDGSGFPKGLNYTQISPMSCAFILAYDFTNLLIKTCHDPEEIDPKAILNMLGEEYTKANFQKPYQALTKALKIY